MAGKKLNWKAAEAKLNKRIADIALWPTSGGQMEIMFTLAPLRGRLDSGERTDELYTAIEKATEGEK